MKSERASLAGRRRKGPVPDADNELFVHDWPIRFSLSLLFLDQRTSSEPSSSGGLLGFFVTRCRGRWYNIGRHLNMSRIGGL